MRRTAVASASRPIGSRRATAACAAAYVLAACGDRSDAERPADTLAAARRSYPALRVLGITPPATWPEQRCGIDVPKTLAPDTLRPYRRCDLKDSTGNATLVLDWERRLVVSGQRSFFHPDSVRWQRFRDSVVAALDAAATPLRCAKPDAEFGDSLEPARHVRLWTLREERRVVMVSAMSRAEYAFDFDPGWIGGLWIKTDTGAVDPCRVLLRPRLRRTFVM